MTTPQAGVVLRQPAAAERLAVAALTRALPAAFRDRQRSEWTGDLVALAHGPAGARWRYLAGAAVALPALRSQLRNAGHAGLDGVEAVAAAQGGELVRAVSWTLVIGLGWITVSWFMVLAAYAAVDMPTAVESVGGNPELRSVWSSGPLVAIRPVVELGIPGAMIAEAGLMLWAVLGTVSVALGILQWRTTAGTRIQLVGIGLALHVVLLLVSANRVGDTAIGAVIGASGARHGATTALTGLGAIAFAAAARRLPRWHRAALALFGTAAVTIFAVLFHSYVQAFSVWLMD